MTVDEACDIVRPQLEGLEIDGVFDYGAFYLFDLIPKDIDKNKPFTVGTIYPIIIKDTGKQATYDIVSDLDAFLKAKKVL